MAVGATAKINVAKKIKDMFGADWIGEFDKKYYVWADDGGEKVQIAISMTHPKVPIDCGGPSVEEESGDLNFETMPPKPVIYTPAEISDEEKRTVAELMEKLGL